MRGLPIRACIQVFGDTYKDARMAVHFLLLINIVKFSNRLPTENLVKFYGCSNLKEVYCCNFSQDWNDAFDESLVGEITLHVPEHALDYVQKSFKKIIPIGIKVKK